MPAIEEVLEGDDITSEDLLDFIRGAPNRDVAIKFPDGSSYNKPIRLVWDEIVGNPSCGRVHTTDNACVVVNVRKQSGWICIEYGCGFEQLERLILRDEPSIVDDEKSKDVVHVFRDVGARIELGLNRDVYEQLISSNYLYLKDAVEFYTEAFPTFSSLIGGILQNHLNALEIWRQGPGEFGYTFSGGGFGLVGAAKGFATAVGLNAIAGAYNAHKSQKMSDILIAEWNWASRKVAIAEKVTRAQRF